jgi:hypothetical protein
MSQLQKQTMTIVSLVDEINRQWVRINSSDHDVATWRWEPMPCVGYERQTPMKGLLLYGSGTHKTDKTAKPRPALIYLGSNDPDIVKHLKLFLKDAHTIIEGLTV